jgi:hypothetical protein
VISEVHPVIAPTVIVIAGFHKNRGVFSVLNSIFQRSTNDSAVGKIWLYPLARIAIPVPARYFIFKDNGLRGYVS